MSEVIQKPITLQEFFPKGYLDDEVVTTYIVSTGKASPNDEDNKDQNENQPVKDHTKDTSIIEKFDDKEVIGVVADHKLFTEIEVHFTEAKFYIEPDTPSEVPIPSYPSTQEVESVKPKDALSDPLDVSLTDTIKYGVPRYIIIDNGKNFKDSWVTDLYEKFGFKQPKSSMYNAPANGLAEAFNKNLCELLKKMDSAMRLDESGSEDDLDLIDLEVDQNENADVQAQPKKKQDTKRKRKLTSKVWLHYDILPPGKDKKRRYRCKKCGTEYIAEGRYDTGNLKRHIDSCVRKDTQDIGQLLLSQSSESISMRASKFDFNRFHELVSAAIIMHNLPFQFVEYEGIRNMCHYLNEEAQPVSRNTAKVDILRMYKNEKGRLRHMLESTNGRISLTSDLWSSLTTDGYLSLTAHFIDVDWRLQKRILHFSYMPSPHNGVALTEKIYTLLVEWGIKKKLFSITLDNASSNCSFIELLKSQLNLNDALLSGGEFFHIRYCTHILNLIVQEGLKEVDESIIKIHESVKYVKGSQMRKQKFFECVPHLSDSNYKFCPSQEEWSRIEKIYNFLTVFYDVTNIFSGSKYPTANLYFPFVFLVQLTLREEMDSRDQFISKMATQMYSKFAKYWSDYSMILAIAVILDPRYKLGFVIFSYNMLNGDNNIESTLVRDALFNLLDQYLLNSPIACTTKSTSSPNDGSEHQQVDEGQLTKKFIDVMKNDKLLGNVQKSELELYLDEPKINRNANLDVLTYWKANQFRYPVLAQMAHDILSIPITTIASESAFSVGGQVLDQYRNALKLENVETLVCTRDWIFGLKDTMKLHTDDLIDDVMKLNINNDDPAVGQCSTSVSVTEH
ncbi:zinc finger BED domain-containing protein RICESLEEPER 2-like [Cornus florida]|uniref:zinc finger BED domain-containing protein RICESLEEPER 2-like n=1 Tax=Cornus florida TaxID=4283 RepID=UPI00289D0F9D|nr:zinc finger BED domain-containing protein RICESLEEPER 2-like [Cornus florida]